MQEVTAKILEFVHFVEKHIKGDEKGQAQIFCDRLFQAFACDLYRTLDLPGKNPLRDLQDELDEAVRGAYGMKAKADPLAFLLDLNHQLAASEKAGTAITGPGLPPCVTEPADFITTDCVQPPTL